jgi:NADH-quinone oxidoreductase subunit N
LKTFVSSAVFTAILLYGISLIYGAVGSLDLETIRVHLEGVPHRNSMLGLGIAMVAFGLLFKVAAVPFHLWMPDAVEGAPTSAAAFVSVVPTVAVFAVLLRLFGGAFSGVADQWVEILWVASAAAMIYGNVAALTQNNVKRLLAYSSVAHTGYALMGLVAVSGAGVRAVIVYSVVFSLMNIGAFGVAALLESGGRVNPSIADFRGLFDRRPGIAAGMLIFLSALAGLPLTAGFVGRMVLWAAAIEAGAIGLVVIAVVASVIGVAVYSRFVVQMVLKNEGAQTLSTADHDHWAAVVVFLCAAAIVMTGLWPEPLLTWAAAGLVVLGVA